MGREIREVPAGWEHPKSEMNYLGHLRGELSHTPLLNDSYAADSAQWQSELAEWLSGFHEAQIGAIVEDQVVDQVGGAFVEDVAQDDVDRLLHPEVTAGL